MPPGTLPDAIFGVILAPSWRQVGPKVEFGRVGKPTQKKNEKNGQQGNPGDPRATRRFGSNPCGPPKETSQDGTPDSQRQTAEARQQTADSRTEKALETLH